MQSHQSRRMEANATCSVGGLWLGDQDPLIEKPQASAM